MPTDPTPEDLLTAITQLNGTFEQIAQTILRAAGEPQVAARVALDLNKPPETLVAPRAAQGLGNRLRALVAGPHPDVLLVRTAEAVWGDIADEADRLEASSNGARIKVQLDRVVALADEWDRAAERRRESDPDMADAYRSRAADLRDVLAQEVP